MAERILRRRIAAVLFAYGLIWGAVTVAGRGERWTGPAFDFARQVAGGPTSWGAALAAFCAAGLIGIALGHTIIPQAAFAASALWSACFTASFVAAGAGNPHASWGVVITWAFHTILFAAAARARFV